MLLAVAIGGGLSFGGAQPANARERVAARLVWDGSVCGSARDFAARVGKRTNVVRFVPRGRALVVRARIERRGEGLEASASIEARGQAPVIRRLQSADCDDALDALALVVAIGVEAGNGASRSGARARRRAAPPRAPAAPLETAPEPPAPDAPEAPTEVPATTPEPLPPATPLPEPPPAPARPEPASPEPTPPPVKATPSLEPPPSEPRARRAPATAEHELDAGARAAPVVIDIGVGVSAAASIGVAPAPLFGGALWISAGWERESVWSPELVVSAQHQRLDGLTRAGGRADFALSFASLSLCPARWGNAAFELRPCASGALGRLDVEGYSTFDPRSRQRPWWAVGGTLEGLARAGVVEFRAVFGATAPLLRDSFLFEGPCAGSSVCEADVFHHVAPVVWSGAVGVGIRIW